MTTFKAIARLAPLASRARVSWANFPREAPHPQRALCRNRTAGMTKITVSIEMDQKSGPSRQQARHAHSRLAAGGTRHRFGGRPRLAVSVTKGQSAEYWSACTSRVSWPGRTQVLRQLISGQGRQRCRSSTHNSACMSRNKRGATPKRRSKASVRRAGGNRPTCAATDFSDNPRDSSMRAASSRAISTSGQGFVRSRP